MALIGFHPTWIVHRIGLHPVESEVDCRLAGDAHGWQATGRFCFCELPASNGSSRSRGKPYLRGP
jgi:hypothetical protein